jgi:hypothetical protein
MGEGGIGVVSDIRFNLLPITLVIANFLAGGANRQKAAQRFNVAQRLRQILD